VKARLTWPSRNGVFAILMVCSLVVMWLPTRWTSGLKCAGQALVPFQSGIYAVTTPASSGADDSSRVSAEEYQQLAGELEAKRNEVVSLRLLIREMEAERPTVAMILRKLADRTATREGSLLPARVIAYNPTAWRDTALLGSGRRRGISEDMWVASRRLLDAGGKDGVRGGMVVLAREYLIGRIDEVTPYRSRLVLLSDLESKAEVWIGRISGDRFKVLPSPDALRAGQRWAESGQEARFFLVGRGKGEMIIGDVHEDYVKQGVLAPGDLVVSAGTSAKLPVAMIFGRIEDIEDDPGQRQLRQLVVRCPIDTSKLRWVYVVDAPPVSKKTTR